MQQFINRDRELDFLHKRYESRAAELILIYGRRRIGKTMLLLKLLESTKGVYFLADKRPEIGNIEELKNSMADFVADDVFRRARFGSWEELLGAFVERIGNQRVALVIDEFPFLVENNQALPSTIAKLWDTVLVEKNLFIVLCGSSIGMMEDLMGYRSPLYGRRTGQWQVMPMDLVQLRDFFPRHGPRDLMRIYGTLDMIPFYLRQFDAASSYLVNVEERILDTGSLLHIEAEFLLRQELREPTRYMAILKSISLGNTRFNQILDETDFDKSTVSKYLSVLEALQIVQQVYPVAERQRRRKALYRLRDNYFDFWFRYVYPNRSLLEQGRTSTVLEAVDRDLNHYLGKIMEKAAAEMLWNWERNGILPFRLRELGPWWEGSEEIDLVGHDGSSNILFVECKWKDLGFRESVRIIEDLEEKQGLVPWKKGKRKPHHCVIARSIEGKAELIAKGHLAFDLEDFWPGSEDSPASTPR
jgi:AAA+ ATPase superfamily predicted ATPase